MSLQQCLHLDGSPGERGALLGKVLGNNLAEERKLSPDPARVRDFEGLLARHAPEWIEEAHAFAGEADIPAENLLFANCRPQVPNQYYLGGCTSFLVMGARSATTHPLLMKIRDEAPLPQYFARRALPLGGESLYGTNAANLGWAHFVNSHGLAGGNNTGSPITVSPAEPAFNDCHMMRLVAEKARDCREALEVLRELLADGVCGTAGYKKGMIFLFSDISPLGLVVELCPARMTHRFVTDGALVYSNHFLLEESAAFTDLDRYGEIPLQSSQTRRQRGRALIGDTGKVSVEDLKSISRDRENGTFAICNDSSEFPWRTISSFIHELDPAGPQVHVCNGSPSQTGYVHESIRSSC